MKRLLFVLVLAFGFCSMASAQNYTFSFQGSLNNAAVPANGNYDFEFVLYDALNAGNQVGSPLTKSGVAVTNGVFSVQLDFGASFPGAARFLEIRVKPSGQPAITTLTPRQPIDSSPYAIKSLNADNAANAALLGGVAADQYVIQTDPRLSNARTPTAGSGDYVQNRNTQQSSTNFNVSGNGTVGGTLTGDTVNAATQFNLGGGRVFRIPGSGNTFIGLQTGDGHTTGNSNTFVGFRPGRLNSSGSSNSFFGTAAGFDNTTGSSNSFFGSSAGGSNTTASENSFFGAFAGADNTGNDNSFFGFRSGSQNTTGGGNAFFGHHSGNLNTTGSTNSFFGYSAGESNTTGLNNAFFGANAGAANTTALGNSFFGANAGAANTTGMGNSFFGASSGLVNTSINNSFFGTVTGVANTTGNSNSFFGHWAGHDNTDGNSNAYFGAFAGEANTTGDSNTFIGANAGDNNSTGSNNTVIGAGSSANPSGSFATVIGAGASTSFSNRVQLGRSGTDTVAIGEMGNAGTFHVCLAGTGGNVLALCSSSRRYKENIQPLARGLELIRSLRPVTFDWKDFGMADLGLIAEEVAEVEPLMVTHNARGEIEGVKYDLIAVVLINAVNAQQTQIETQEKEIAEHRKTITRQQVEFEKQRQEFDALKKLVCSQNLSAEICKPAKLTLIEREAGRKQHEQD